MPLDITIKNGRSPLPVSFSISGSMSSARQSFGRPPASDSVTTLRDANAHLAYEVGELRALRDHLLPQIKQKLSQGLLSKRIGTQ